MTYTTLALAGLGLLGILIHNLVKLNSLNRASDGHLNFGKYMLLERFSIALSVCVVIVSLIVRSEIKELEIAGNWLGFTFVTIGYMAQSIVTALSGKAEKFIQQKSATELQKPE